MLVEVAPLTDLCCIWSTKDKQHVQNITSRISDNVLEIRKNTSDGLQIDINQTHTNK